MPRIYLRALVQNVAIVRKIVTIYYFEYEKDYRSTGESHDFWELNYVDRGHVIVACDGEEYTLARGDVILLPPNQYHSLRADGMKPSSVFIISFEVESELLDTLGCILFTLNENTSGELNDLIRQCRQTYNLPMENLPVLCLQVKHDALSGAEQMVRLRLEIFLISLIRLGIDSQLPYDRNPMQINSKEDAVIANKVMDMLISGIYCRLTLDKISMSMKYSKTYIVNAFRKVYGTSIMAYYTQLKIDEAKRLIHDGEATITEVSEILCFSTPQYFSKCFKQHVGMSPKEFKNSVNGTWSTVKNAIRYSKSCE